MTHAEQVEMWRACCHCCTLSDAMRDCDACLFAQAGTKPHMVAVAEPATAGEQGDAAYMQADLSKPSLVADYIVTRSWADQHLNSDADLKYFPGKAVIK